MGVIVFLLDLKPGIIPAAEKKINYASRNRDIRVCFVWDPKASKFPVTSKPAFCISFVFFLFFFALVV